jgi:hypothetical protein
MENMGLYYKFKEAEEKWLKCFQYLLKQWGFTSKNSMQLFYNFSMTNWPDLHLENTEYAGNSKNELFNKFCEECNYCSDRMTFDRLFRTHWLFLQAFEKEMEDRVYKYGAVEYCSNEDTIAKKGLH